MTKNIGNALVEVIDIVIYVDSIEYPEVRYREDVVVKIDATESNFTLIYRRTTEES